MKKVFMFAVLTMLVLGSCKKNSSNKTTITNPIGFSATIDGVNETFATAVTAQIVTITGTPKQTLAINAYITTGASGDNMEVEIVSDTTITRGVYTSNANNTNQPAYPLITYTKNVDSNNTLIFGTDFDGVDITTINITSITSTNVQGTFSGVLINQAEYSDTEAITNGKFNVNISSK